MLTLPPSVKIYICTQPVSMHKSFDGLAGMARDVLGENPMAGHLFVFRNKRADKMKILFWDRNGFLLFYKRLERGTFRFPATAKLDQMRIEVEAPELALMLEGIELAGCKRRPRWNPQDEKLFPKKTT